MDGLYSCLEKAWTLPYRFMYFDMIIVAQPHFTVSHLHHFALGRAECILPKLDRGLSLGYCNPKYSLFLL